MLTLLTIFLYGCSNDSENDLVIDPNDGQDTDNGGDDNNGDPTATINYTDHIAPIMSNSCIGCHSNPPNNGAPFPLISYSQVSQRANSILSAMNKQSGTPGAMPTSGRLPQATIDLVEQWIADGKLEN